ncbi:TadE/TadG family type IV pilus assembly protein [Streptomyces pristinaespiralis]|jgi:Flp pilus assembly protein TadG|uniref:Septum site-determining protein n=2 Tax=Streptomyces pristinaespiralis TaxID=38300 RepID=D6X705_STRE2|nr:TadE/TadG family type IV pilus assembly protein [Streptomyces pristinaespiralis]ALC21163.1 septum formation initiator [Streptomyces pristinaespiralis]EFH31097.1 septum site-determining protein [Streptomyces pristinaespiralis ATCC 25486]QMU16080.1 pilus assembly protein [Streptomyces pristinaespiralis]
MRRHDLRDDRGQSAVEYGGWLFLLLFVMTIAVQVGLAVFAAQQAGTAARAAARVAAQDEATTSPQAAGAQALSSWLAAEIVTRRDGDAVTADVEVTIPGVVPGISFGTVTKSATMPLDRESTR